MAKQEELIGESGHLSHEGVALYVDALKLERVTDLPSDLRLHVEDCFECKSAVTALYSLVGEETYFRAQPHPTFSAKEPRVRREMPVFMKAAAAVVVLLGAGLLLYRLLPTDAPAVPPVAKEDAAAPAVPPTAQPEQPPPGDPLAFAESPGMEVLVDGAFRSSGVEGVVPRNGARVRPGTTFSWTWDGGGSRSAELIILNNREAVLRSVKIATEAYVLRDTLPAGIYYWKLIGEGELLHAGKFFVR